MKNIVIVSASESSRPDLPCSKLGLLHFSKRARKLERNADIFALVDARRPNRVRLFKNRVGRTGWFTKAKFADLILGVDR